MKMHQNYSHITYLLLFTLTILGCQTQQVTPSRRKADKRADTSREHLAGEGGKLLHKSIAAHGGLSKWYLNGPLKFRWTYHLTDFGPNIIFDSTQVIDTWSSRAVHTWHSGTHKTADGEKTIRFGWDGQKAWILPADAKTPVPHHFWSLTPYYFVGIPFVLADEGTQHRKLEDIVFQGKSYHQVKITYAPGTGATPDDYYVVLIDPETMMVRAARYTVTDPAVLQGKPVTEKLITFENYKKVQGIYLPQGHHSYAISFNDGKPVIGQKIRHTQISEIEFVTKENIFFESPK